jgi:hypothetical protein
MESLLTLKNGKNSIVFIGLCVLLGLIAGTSIITQQYLVTGSLMGIFYVWLCLKNPSLGLYAYILLIPVFRNVSIGEITVLPMIGLVVGFCYPFWKIVTRTRMQSMGGSIKYIIAFACILLLSTKVNGSYLKTTYVLRQYMQLMILTFLVVQLTNNFNSLKVLIWLLVLSQLFTAITICLEAYSFIPKHFLHDFFMEDRASGTENDPNIAAFNINVTIPLVFFLFRFYWTNGKIRFILILVGIIDAFAIFQTVSLGGAIGLMVAVCTSAYLIRHGSKMRIVYFVLMLLFGIGICIAIFNNSKIEQRVEIKRNELEDVDLLNKSRIGRWQGSVLAIRENPVIGAGPGGNQSIMEYITGWRGGSHNVFLSVAVEVGILGLFFFILTFLPPLLNLWRKSKQYNKPHIGAEYTLLNSTFITMLFTIFAQSMLLSTERSIILWIFLGMVISFLNISKKDIEVQ